MESISNWFEIGLNMDSVDGFVGKFTLFMQQNFVTKSPKWERLNQSHTGTQIIITILSLDYLFQK